MYAQNTPKPTAFRGCPPGQLVGTDELFLLCSEAT
jgi:hypothetical protein